MSTADATPRPVGPNVSRRRYLQLVGGGAAAAAGVGWHTQRAAAIPPFLVAGGYAAGKVLAPAAAGAAAGWTIREWEVLGADDPPEGLTGTVLENSIYKSARKRKSNNKSTFIDNRNIVESGQEHAAYTEGKIAAIEALNDEKQESDVLASGQSAMDSHETTVKKNLLKSWNESVRELRNMAQGVMDHSDLSLQDLNTGTYSSSEHVTDVRDVSRSHEMPDGSSFEIERVALSSPNDYPAEWDPINESVSAYNVSEWYWNTAEGEVVYLRYSDWNDIWNTVDSAFQNARDGLSRWVSNVYGDVQAGELDAEELFTSRELAEMMPDGEGYPQAVADLMALNVSIDLEREAEIDLQGIDGTVYGSLAVSSEPEGGISAGETIDPSSRDEDYYLTYDISEGHGVWNDYETGIDGGVLTFTSEPYAQTVYSVTTLAGETVELRADDFSETDSGGAWTVDLSDQLATSITEVAEITFFADVDGTQYETVMLQEPFEVVTFRDSQGNEYDTTTFSSSEPQSDDNYITQDEWDAMLQRQEELIQKYEDAQNGGGGIPWPDLGLGGGSGGIVGIVLLALAGLFGINAATN